jgi:hypothetical protein
MGSAALEPAIQGFGAEGRFEAVAADRRQLSLTWPVDGCLKPHRTAYPRQIDDGSPA